MQPNLRPDLHLVLRFTVDAVPVQRAKNISCWKGTWGRCLAVGTEYCHSAIKYIDVAIVAECMLISLSGRCCKASRLDCLAPWSPSTVKCYRQRILHITHPMSSSRQAIEMGERAVVVVLISFRLGIYEVGPIYHETIPVCDSPHLFTCVRLTSV